MDVFQDENDLFVPIACSKYYAEKLRDVTFNIIPGEGHFYAIAYGYATLYKVKQMYYYKLK